MGLSLAANPLELFIPEVPANCPDPISHLPGTWFVAKTLSRCEKSLATFLFNAGIPYLLPMIAARTASRNTVLNPLFAGFIFILAPFPPPLRPSAAVLKASGYEALPEPTPIHPGCPATSPNLLPPAPADAELIPPSHSPSSSPSPSSLPSPSPSFGPLADACIQEINAERIQYANSETAALAAASRQTCGFIWALNQLRFLRELRVLASETARTRTLRFEAAHTLSRKKGHPVTVTAGPMLGLDGLYLRRPCSSAADRIVIELKTLGRVVSVEISEKDVEFLEV